MKHPIVNLLVRWLVLGLGVVLSAKIVPGIRYDDEFTLFVVVLLLSLFNAVLKPLLLLFTLPLIVLSLGVGIWFINALIFYFIGALVDGFHVAGFGSALLGALIVSVVNVLLTRMITPAPVARPPASGPASRRERPGDDVIDV